MEAGGPTSQSTIISTQDVSKRFAGGAADVLRAVSIRIREGEAVAIVGSNGAGKSTLLKCIVGLVPLSGGEIEIFGERFNKQPNANQRKRIRRNLGFVFQFHGLVARLSTLSNVVHGAIGQGHGIRAWHQAIATDELRADAIEALRRVGLADRAHDRAEALSGGQSQRVAIARAIIHNPKLLIADEPVASLDPSTGTDVMQLFRNVAGGEISLIYTTHNVDHALAYSDRIIAMRDGEVAFDCPTAEVSESDLRGIYRG